MRGSVPQHGAGPAVTTLAAMIDIDLLRRDLTQLVSLASVGGSEAEVLAQRWCAATLTGLGLDVDLWPIDLDALRADPDFPGEEVDRTEAWGCVGTSGPGTPALVLNGHVDVVPPGDLEAWTGADPWILREVDGTWFGRGVCDMKGGVAAIIAAARAVLATGTSLARPFAVHTVVGEEDGGLGAFATLRRGHTGDACLIAEPTAGTIVTANAGALTFRIELTGSSTHGSRPDAGVSAIEVFEAVHASLRALDARRNTAPPEPFDARPFPISVGTVQAGDWASTIPDRLVAEGRFGTMPGESFADAVAVFEAAVAATDHPWLREHPAVVTWPGGRFAAGRLPEGDAFLDEVRVAAGDPPMRAVGAPYGSDLRQYATAGVPTLQLGPGDIANAHTVDESVRVDEVVAAAETYARLILARCRA